MTDQDLLAFGCMVMAFAIGGAYVALRARFWEHEEKRERDTERVPVRVTGQGS
ncbi:hypothetical protein MYXO_02599 [Myxococcaceae bacterium]|jgi:hypothetical protein|nr:hypothetical protein MYXO_02599 [Myxococcaceae bacterium]